MTLDVGSFEVLVNCNGKMVTPIYIFFFTSGPKMTRSLHDLWYVRVTNRKTESFETKRGNDFTIRDEKSVFFSKKTWHNANSQISRIAIFCDESWVFMLGITLMFCKSAVGCLAGGCRVCTITSLPVGAFRLSLWWHSTICHIAVLMHDIRHKRYVRIRLTYTWDLISDTRLSSNVCNGCFSKVFS